jgi:splicing factor U2AF subunit
MSGQTPNRSGSRSPHPSDNRSGGGGFGNNNSSSYGGGGRNYNDDRRGGGGYNDDRRGGGQRFDNRGGGGDRRYDNRGGNYNDDRRGGYGGGQSYGQNNRGGQNRGGGSGAEYLARIHGTEEDKVNCPFYFKIGACRHGDKCSRLHHKPPFAQTVLLKHFYQNPIALITAVGGNPASLDKQQCDEEYLDFYEDVYAELSKFGKVEQMHVCDNLGEHIVGHIYCKYSDEEEALDCVKAMENRHFGGRLIKCEYSPVTDFKEARCRQFDEESCDRGGMCNFMHIKRVPDALLKELESEARELRMAREAEERKNRPKRSRSRSSSRSSRSYSRSRSRSYSRSRSKSSDSRSPSRSASRDRSPEKGLRSK